jgi:uncharacterized membrane protein
MDAPVRKRRRWYNPVAIFRSIYIRPRVFFAAAFGMALLWFLPVTMPLPVRESVAWCAAAMTYLVFALALMATCGSDRIKLRAGVQDDSAVLILAIILVAIFSSLSAIFALLSAAKGAHQGAKMLYLGLAAATISTSWLVMQVAFAIHYAHQYYRPQHAQATGVNGLDFPKDQHPDYWDFLYFSTSLGAASQTSDVAINSKELRRLATLHAIVSFFFNVTVVALTINLAASLV